MDIYIPVGSKKRNKQQTENEAGNKPKNSREDTRPLIVRQEGKTYADLSGQLKITSMPIRWGTISEVYVRLRTAHS